jgi:hypothetical protein
VIDIAAGLGVGVGDAVDRLALPIQDQVLHGNGVADMNPA